MAPPRELSNLLLALGADPNRAPAIVAGILDWRAGTPGGSFSEFDQFYLSLTPSFRARHASLQEIEELLLVRGITPDLFYGSYTRDAEGKVHPARRPARLPVGLWLHGTVGCEYRDAGGDGGGRCRSGYRRGHRGPAQDSRPFTTWEQLAPFSNGGKGMGRLGMIERNRSSRLRATAQLRLPNGQLSDVAPHRLRLGQGWDRIGILPSTSCAGMTTPAFCNDRHFQ